MRVSLYTLEQLAKKEGVTYEYLRQVAVKYGNRQINEWRGWHFITIPSKCNLAYKPALGVEVELIK